MPLMRIMGLTIYDLRLTRSKLINASHDKGQKNNELLLALPCWHSSVVEADVHQQWQVRNN